MQWIYKQDQYVDGYSRQISCLEEWMRKQEKLELPLSKTREDNWGAGAGWRCR